MLRNKVTDIVPCRVAEVRPGPVSANLEITFDDGYDLWKSWLPALSVGGRRSIKVGDRATVYLASSFVVRADINGRLYWSL
jgi:hypothetical protein